jgi:hypothetical protein
MLSHDDNFYLQIKNHFLLMQSRDENFYLHI